MFKASMLHKSYKLEIHIYTFGAPQDLLQSAFEICQSQPPLHPEERFPWLTLSVSKLSSHLCNLLQGCLVLQGAEGYVPPAFQELIVLPLLSSLLGLVHQVCHLAATQRINRIPQLQYSCSYFCDTSCLEETPHRCRGPSPKHGRPLTSNKTCSSSVPQGRHA